MSQDCHHCGVMFDTNDEFVNHLIEDHADELTRIDQRRIEKHPGASVPSDSDEIEISGEALMLTLAILFVIVALFVAWRYDLFGAAMGA